MIRIRRRPGGIPPGVLATSASVTAEASARAAADLLLASKSKTVNTQTGDYTLVLVDADSVVEMNKATANTLTVPPNASVAFPVGTVIRVVQLGAGLTTIAAGAGVTIRSTGGVLALAGQYDQTTLIKRGTNEWEMAPTSAAYAPLRPTWRAVFTSVTAAHQDVLLVDTTAANRTITPPTNTAGAWFMVKKKVAANTVTITGAGDGGADVVISTQYEAHWFFGDGSAWWEF